MPSIIEKYNDFALSKNSAFMIMQKELQAKIAETDKLKECLRVEYDITGAYTIKE